MNNKTLYRDHEQGKIAGVCAGFANYFGLEAWVVRILTVTAFFLLAGPFVFFAYIAAWFVLDKKPAGYTQTASQHARKIEVKQSIYKSGEPPRQAFFDIHSRFKDAETRLRRLEGYITSKEYQLKREINRL